MDLIKTRTIQSVLRNCKTDVIHVRPQLRLRTGWQLIPWLQCRSRCVASSVAYSNYMMTLRDGVKEEDKQPQCVAVLHYTPAAWGLLSNRP